MLVLSLGCMETCLPQSPKEQTSEGIRRATPTDAADVCFALQRGNLHDQPSTPIGPFLEQVVQILDVPLIFF